MLHTAHVLDRKCRLFMVEIVMTCRTSRTKKNLDNFYASFHGNRFRSRHDSERNWLVLCGNDAGKCLHNSKSNRLFTSCRFAFSPDFFLQPHPKTVSFYMKNSCFLQWEIENLERKLNFENFFLKNDFNFQHCVSYAVTT